MSLRLASPLLFSPIVDGLANSLGGEIAAQHLVLGDAAQSFRHALLCDLVSLLDGLAPGHFGSNGRTGDGNSTAHAFESRVRNYAVLDAQGDQNRIAIDRASHDCLAGCVIKGACISGMFVVVADLFVVQRRFSGYIEFDTT